VNVWGSKAFRLAAAAVAALLVLTVALGWSHAAPKAVPKPVVRPTAVMHPTTTSHKLPAPRIAATNP